MGCSELTFLFLFKGKIIGRVGNAGRQFILQWNNGEESLQNFNHMLGGSAKNPSLGANECVFANRRESKVFYPGRIIGRRGENLIVKFYDDKMYYFLFTKFFNYIFLLDFVCFILVMRM